MCEKICAHHFASREQRKNELKAGLGEEGTIGFENMGCYECDGYKLNCPSYFCLDEKIEIEKDSH